MARIGKRPLNDGNEQASCIAQTTLQDADKHKMAMNATFSQGVRKGRLLKRKSNLLETVVISRKKTLMASEYYHVDLAGPTLIMRPRDFLELTKAFQQQKAVAKHNQHVSDFRRQVLERKQELHRLLNLKAEQM